MSKNGSRGRKNTSQVQIIERVYINLEKKKSYVLIFCENIKLL